MNQDHATNGTGDDAARDALTNLMIDISTFTPFDWLLVAVVVYSTIVAAMRGFFREAFSLAGLIVGSLLASWNYEALAKPLEGFMPWRVAQIVAFLAIAIAVMVLCGIAGKLLHRTAQSIGLGFVDRLLGTVFGVLRGFLMGVVLMVAAAAFLPNVRYIGNSALSGYFLEGAHAVSFVVPANLQQHIREGTAELRHSKPDWIKRSK
jgi:membrane protein required for colicin V production